MIDLLGLVRDELYNKETFGTKEVAEMLGVSTRHVRRLAQEGTLRKEGRGLFLKEHIADWKRNQCPLEVSDDTKSGPEPTLEATFEQRT